MDPRDSTELEAQNLLQMEANSKLESIEQNTEATLLEVSKTKDVVKDLEPILEAIAVKMAKDVQKFEFIGPQLVTIKGEKGDRGERGEDGPRGDKGDIGPKGENSKVPGPKGDKGDRGDRGDKGERGERGQDSTVTGPKGEQGEKGEPGKDGSPDTPLEIAKKLNTLKKEVDWGVLKNVPDNLGRKSGGPGYLRELSDVEILTEPSNNQALSWDNIKKRWVPKTPTGTGSGFSVEIPVGAVNGSNATFEVVNEPKSLMWDGLMKEVNQGTDDPSYKTYTYVAGGIGFIITIDGEPPLYQLRSYY